MKKEYNIIFSTIFIFVLSCTNNQLNTNPKTSSSPIPTQTSSVNPNTSGQYTNNQINNINISNNISK